MYNGVVEYSATISTYSIDYYVLLVYIRIATIHAKLLVLNSIISILLSQVPIFKRSFTLSCWFNYLTDASIFKRQPT